MARAPLLLPTLLAFSCVGAVGFVVSTTMPATALTGASAKSTNQSAEFVAVAKVASPDSDAFLQDLDASAPLAAALNNPASQPKLDQLIAAVNADDPELRAAAIDALALEPKLGAAPVLQSLLSARAAEDRLLALNALHRLALNQGDEDGVIRNVVRLTIYESDDEDLAKGAQVVLDDLDRDLGQVAPASAP